MSQWRIGDVTVTKIVEQEVSGGSRLLLPKTTPDWLLPYLTDGNGCLRLSIHSFIVEAPTRRIIVDTCLGNVKQNCWRHIGTAGKGRFLADLTECRLSGRVDRHRCEH